MMNIYHYIAPLPEGVNEAILSSFDGYTIYTADRLDDDSRRKAFLHALRHIENNDFEKEDVNAIEKAAHTCDGVQAAGLETSLVSDKKGR